MVAEHFCGTLDTSLPDDMESFNKNVRSHKMLEVPVCDARHPQRPLLAKINQYGVVRKDLTKHMHSLWVLST